MAQKCLTLAAGEQLANKNGLLTGYNFRETSGSAAASVKIFSGVSAVAAKLIATVGLVANDSKDITFPDNKEIQFVGAIFTVVTGTVEGVIRWQDQ